MKQTDIHLGFEIGTGNPVEIPCRHMVVSGQTQEAGKTTTLEALIARSGLPAVAFVTKRGEGSFAGARRIEPYFRERADWQFVCSILEATMREKMKFERNWIIKASKGARTLADVQRNVKTLLLSARGINEGVYTTLDAYLEIVVPRIASVTFAPAVELQAGVNTVDLSDRESFPPELQSLVMRSVLEWIYERESGTIAIIPEAWEFIPQGRGSPVKLAAIELIRKGAGLKNYVWLDSQDIGGVEKELLRSCPVWLLGVQREANEIGRTLSNIPSGIAKPKPSDIATLERGQFFACWGKHVVKTYVQPTWMGADEARAISMGGEQKTFPVAAPRTNKNSGINEVLNLHAGKGTARIVTGQKIPPHEQSPLLTGTPTIKTKPKENNVTKIQADKLTEENQQLRDRIAELEKSLKPAGRSPAQKFVTLPLTGDDPDELYAQLLARLLKEPAIIELRRCKPELNVAISRKTIQADETTAQGMIVILLGEGFFNNTATAQQAWKELKRRWNYGGISARAYEQLDKLTELGFVTKEADGYLSVPGMKVNITKE